MPDNNFVISTRNVTGTGNNAEFGSEPGDTRYLIVPNGEIPHPVKHVASDVGDWVEALRERAKTGTVPADHRNRRAGYDTGDILIFVHGYNNSMKHVMDRHDLLQKNLALHGYRGAVVSFDWPSAESTLGYLEDRNDALATAQNLVTDGIRLLAFNQYNQDQNQCDIDLHVLGHSTGAYVIREGFYLADHNATISRFNWQVSQIAFIGGDIARKSMSADDGKSKSMFTHAARITNYQSPFDNALKVSNVKRLGTAPRVGRVGLPDDPPENVVNVDVGDYWERNVEGDETRNIIGNRTHSWHFSDETFCRDLALTLKGDIDRNRIPTRETHQGGLRLKPA